MALKGAIVLTFNDSQCSVYSIASVFVRALFTSSLPSYIGKEDLELLVLLPSPPKCWTLKLCHVIPLVCSIFDVHEKLLKINVYVIPYTSKSEFLE